MLDRPNTIMFIYGPSSYYTYYPVTSTSCLWALYQRPKNGAVESLSSRRLTSKEQEARRQELLQDLKGWPEFVTDTVYNSSEILYLKVCDRKVLQPEQWYSDGGRCVLLGDAAHPLTPHSGQGANQALWVPIS
jgi:salicylate hydroxylase